MAAARFSQPIVREQCNEPQIYLSWYDWIMSSDSYTISITMRGNTETVLAQQPSRPLSFTDMHRTEQVDILIRPLASHIEPSSAARTSQEFLRGVRNDHISEATKGLPTPTIRPYPPFDSMVLVGAVGPGLTR